MIIETDGNMLENIKPWSILLHQVNCLGIAGAGIAKQIRDMFPGWYADYKNTCAREKYKEYLLGTIRAYSVKPDLIICSAFAQFDISKSRPVTDYDAWDLIMKKIESETAVRNTERGMNWEIRVPYGIGCGLGGGNWQKMRDMFEFYFGRSSVRLIIYKYKI